MDPETALTEFTKWCERRRRAPNTVVNYRYLFHRFIAAANITSLADVGPASVDAYLDTYRHLADSTMYKHLSLLRTVFNWFEDRSYISPRNNPFRDYELPRFTARLREPLTMPDLDALLNHIPTDSRHRARYTYSGYRDNLIWHFCALAGMRISEVLHLHLADLRDELIYIREAKDHSSRAVPILPRLQATIDRYMPYLHWQLGRAPALDDLLFPGTPITHCLHTPYIWERFRRAQIALGFQRRYTFHSLRHTYATALLRQAVNVPTVQKLLGHKALASTQVYLHVADEEVRAAALRHPLAMGSAPC